MPELRQLHELAGQVRTPDLADLAVVADGRRRRSAAAVGGAVAVTLVVVALVAGNLNGNRGAAPLPVGPGPQTSSTATTPRPDPSASYPALSPEAIRRHPTAALDSDSLLATTAAPAGVAARVWTACLGDCTRATEYVPGEVQKVLEVSNDDFTTSSLYPLDASGSAAHVVDDWFFTENFDGPAVVSSRGQRRPLEFGAPIPVTEVSGPVLHTLQGEASIDLAAGTVHPLQREGNDQTWEWGGAGDTWYWGTVVLVDNGPVARHAVLWRGPGGTFAVKVLPVPESEGGPGMLTAKRPGTMAVVEHYASPRLAHISTDYGATWQVRQVPDGVESGGALPANWRTWARG